MTSQIFRIVFEDDAVLVIEKLVPFLSQRADRGEKEALPEFIARTKKIKIYPVHRLDREVLGLMVFGKTRAAADSLSDQFRERKVKKSYLATLVGKVQGEGGRLEHYLLKNEKTKHVTVFPKPTPGAKRASLEYRIVERAEKSTTVLIALETGRTHQIRAQFAKIGHPIVGDPRYGKQLARSHRSRDQAREFESEESSESAIQLRSVLLGFFHPVSKNWLEWNLLE